MWVTNATGITPAGNTPSAPSNFNVSTNQLSSSNYDAAGNQLMANGYQLTYDAENRQTSASTGSTIAGTYGYDGDGNRVIRTPANGTTVYVYDALGQLAAEYSSGATAASPCQTCYLHRDHLGTVRLITHSIGTVAARHDYLPFGEAIPSGIPAGATGRDDPTWAASDNINQKFTGKERDPESGLDYFGARYYGSALGRFTSPDEPLVDQDPSDPQSWNLYSYVRNNPLSNIDPGGNLCQAGTYTVTDGNGTVIQKIDVADFSTCGYLLLGDLASTALNVGQQAQQVVQSVGHFIAQPRNPTCLAASTAAGALTGAEVGMLGLAGGPAVLVTDPAAMLFGGGVGWLGGMVSCMSSRGGTGGSSGEATGDNQPPLKKLHSDSTLSKTSLDFWRKKSTEEIVDSLRPGNGEALRVKADGTIVNGNTRITILQERGFNVNTLPRELH